MRSTTGTWLVSRRFDLAIFLWPAVIALLLVPLGPWLAPEQETPLPFWILSVLMIDVAHVWSTIYLSYFRGIELRSRPARYIFAPLAAFLLAYSSAAHSFQAFWTMLAYLAVFHFVRQQYGWVALYQRRQASIAAFDYYLDRIVIYVATLGPVFWWHLHLPRRFDWFLPGDFFRIEGSEWLKVLFWIVYGLFLSLYVLRQLSLYIQQRQVFWGKNIVVVSSALCWGIGIIATNSDWAFTVTNVIIHGVPYMAFVWITARGLHQKHAFRGALFSVFEKKRWLFFLLILFALAYVEEWGWDRSLWHTHQVLFPGPEIDVSKAWVPVVVAILSLPQITHYILDGLIWRRGQGPR